MCASTRELGATHNRSAVHGGQTAVGSCDGVARGRSTQHLALSTQHSARGRRLEAGEAVADFAASRPQWALARMHIHTHTQVCLSRRRAPRREMCFCSSKQRRPGATAISARRANHAPSARRSSHVVGYAPGGFGSVRL
jgi:hypothetical protein